MALLEQAIELAVTAHTGQVDEDDDLHILHSLAVMFGAKKLFEQPETFGYTGTVDELMIAAVLHDTVEDTFVTLPMIEAQFGTRIRDLVDGVTRRGLGKDETKESYRDFIYRAKQNPGSRLIKVADLTHNYGRSGNIKKASWRDKLQSKYSVALRVLGWSSSLTWEQASASVSQDGPHTRYLISDPNGKKIEVSEAEFKTLTGGKGNA